MPNMAQSWLAKDDKAMPLSGLVLKLVLLLAIFVWGFVTTFITCRGKNAVAVLGGLLSVLFAPALLRLLATL
jgi:hypothetical protein